MKLNVAAILCVGLMVLADQRPLAADTDTMTIGIKIDGRDVSATLLDNPTSRDFVSMLPLTVTLDDYGDTEKVAYLPRTLSTTGAPRGSEPSSGDFSYYAPWGNLALFRKDFRYSPGLIKLGKIVSGADALNIAGPMTATIELVEKPR